MMRSVKLALIVALVAVLCSHALADGSLSALPGVGASQKYTASESTTMSQSGTLTVARIAVDSVHITTADGLPALDQSLSVNAQGTVTQPSPASPFIDLLNYIAAILAVAPTNPQKGVQWDAKLSAMTPIETAGESMAAGTPYASQKMPAVNLPITIATKLDSISGSTLKFHGEGQTKQYAATIAGNYGESITTTIDFVLKSGVMQSATRTTTLATGAEANPFNMSYVTSLNAK